MDWNRIEFIASGSGRDIRPVPISAQERHELQLRLLEANSGFPDTLYAILTGKCSKACAYCYLAKQMPEFPDATLHLIAGIEAFADEATRNGLKKARVLLFGGEPGLDPVTIHRILEKTGMLRREGFDLQPVIFTNGLAIQEDVIAHGLACNMHWVVSVDGPVGIQAQTRPDKFGFEIASLDERLAVLNAFSADWEIDVVLTPLTMTNLPTVLEYFSRYSPKRIGANTLTGFSGIYSKNDQVTLGAYTKQLIDTLPLLDRAEVVVYQLEPLLKAFRERSPRLRYQCEISAKKVVIDGAGTWMACEFFAGRQAFKDIANLRNYSRGIREEHPYFWARCKDCHALTVCGGGCTYLSRDNVDFATCHVNREICSWLIRSAWDGR